MDIGTKVERIAAAQAKKDRHEARLTAYAMSGVEFQGFPKVKRLNRDIIITEKLDGTNAAIGIQEVPPETDGGTGYYIIYAQSRNRIITPEYDNYGFAAWVDKHQAALIECLGPGLHFGEWWGQGIARKYDLTEKRFSLFNVARWTTLEGLLQLSVAQAKGVAIHHVPVLYEGPWHYDSAVYDPEVYAPEREIDRLRIKGSVAAPGFMNPEGIMVFHKASGTMFKATLENDAEYKGGKRDQDNNMIEGQ